MNIDQLKDQPTLGAAEMAELFGSSKWFVYQHADEFPVAPIRVGRLQVADTPSAHRPGADRPPSARRCSPSLGRSSNVNGNGKVA